MFHIFIENDRYLTTADKTEAERHERNGAKVYEIAGDATVIFDNEERVEGFDSFGSAGYWYAANCGHGRFTYRDGTLSYFDLYNETTTDVATGITEIEAYTKFARFYRNPVEPVVMYETESFETIADWIERQKARADID